MRSCSPKRIALTATVVGVGSLLLLLLLFSAMSVMEFAEMGGEKRAALPTKTDRSVAAWEEFVDGGDGVEGVREAGHGGSAGEVLAESKSKEADGEAKRGAEAGVLVSEKEGTESNLARLRRRLLERAGYLALHGEDPAKNLVLVAQTFYRGGDRAPAMEWFEKARRMASDPDNTVNSSKALREVMKGLLVVGEFERAEQLIAEIPLSGERDLARAEVATAFARKGKFEEALRMAGTVVEAGARAVALRGVADGQARLGRLNDAINTVNGIAAGPLQDDAWMRVALARVAMGDGTGAANVLGRISDDRARVLAGLKVAEAQAKSGGAGLIEILLAAMHDPFLRDESLRRIVEAQVARADFDAAEASAFRITDENEQALAMEALVGLQVRSGELQGALLRARNIDIAESRSRALRAVALGVTVREGTVAGRNVAGLIMDSKERDQTYRQVAERSAALGRPLDALMTVYNIDAPAERAATLATLAQWRARRGAVSPALVLLQDAVREVEQIPQQKHQEKALGMLASAYAEARESTVAMSTAASIENVGLRDRAYQQLTRKFAAVPDIGLAERSAAAIQVEKTREQALDAMAQTVAGKVAPSKALGVVGKFEKRRQQVKFLLAVAQRI